MRKMRRQMPGTMITGSPGSLKDLPALTPYISGSLPEELYGAAERTERDPDRWKQMYSDLPDEDYDRFCEEEYGPLGEWFYDRCMDSGHLTEGPLIGYFRCGDRMKILWDSVRTGRGQGSIWKYPSGAYEMKYADFAAEVSRFVNAFLRDMDAQTMEVVRHGIPGVFVDREALIRENRQRREIFGRQLQDLYAENRDKTDWKKIRDLYEKMRGETGGRRQL